MIILDTHVWVWWVHGSDRLTQTQIERISSSESGVVGVSAISCWEVAKLVQYGRLALPCPLDQWLAQALSYPGLELVPLSPEIAVESTRLPGEFHRDPADQIIVATARLLSCPLITSDHKIRCYPQRSNNAAWPVSSSCSRNGKPVKPISTGAVRRSSVLMHCARGCAAGDISAGTLVCAEGHAWPVEDGVLAFTREDAPQRPLVQDLCRL